MVGRAGLAALLCAAAVAGCSGRESSEPLDISVDDPVPEAAAEDDSPGMDDMDDADEDFSEDIPQP